MSLQGQIDRALAGLQTARKHVVRTEREKQIRKGTREEMREHAATIRRVKRNPKMPARKVAEGIAREHVSKNLYHYEQSPKKQPGLKSPRIKLLGRRGKLRIYLVATTPTKRIYVDWTEGGHDHVYKFIPKNEVWISDDLPPMEILLTTLHELTERRLMSTRGMDYDAAHDESLKREDKYRKANGRGLKQALVRERGQ